MELRHQPLDRKSRYGLAVAVSVAFFFIRLAFQPLMGGQIPLQLLNLAVLTAAGLGGLGPGLLATLLSVVLVQCFGRMDDNTDLLSAVTFILNGALVSGIAEAMYRAFQRLRDQRAALQKAEELARTQLAEIETIYRYAPVGMCVLDADLRWRRVNEQLARANGFPPEAHVGKGVAELLPHLAHLVEPALRRVIETGEPRLDYTVVGETPAQPGVQRTWKENMVPVKDATGRVVAINVVTEEVTERLAAEQTLRASEERFRALVQATANVVWTMRHMGASDPTISAWWSEFTGRSDSGSGQGGQPEWLEAIHPDDREGVAGMWHSAVTHVRPLAWEFRIRARSGAYHWFSCRMVPRLDVEGALLEWVCTLRDITNRKHAEDSVRESEARFRAMFELASVGMLEVDYPSGRMVNFNERFLQITGYTSRELGELHVRELTHAEDREADWELYVSAANGERPQYQNEKRYVRKDRTEVWVRVNASFLRDPAGGFVHSMAVVEDVTARKMAEEALQESERHYRLLFETMRQGVVYQDMSGRIVSANQAAEEILGKSRQELLDETSITLQVHTLDERGMKFVGNEHPTMKALRTGKGVEGVLMQVFNPRESQFRWIEVSAVPLFLPGAREPYRVYGIFSDVTEKRRSAEELQRNHERLRLALESAHAGTFEAHVPSGKMEISAGGLRLYGFPEDARPNLSECIARVHPEDQAKVRRAMEQATHYAAGYSMEFRILHPSGRIGWVASRAQPLLGPSGEVEGVIGALLDATERMEAARALSRAKEAAEAASRAKDDFLAALSHELRTPLSPVLLLAAEGAANTEFAVEARNDFQLIRKQVALEARLIDDLLDLTRITKGKLALESTALDVHTVLKDAISTVHAEVEAKQQRVVMSLLAERTAVRGDAVRLQQVFWNVLRNAVKFTPQHGSLTVRTHNLGEKIEISVEDSGIGMTAAELGTIFDSFAQGEHAGPGGSHRFGGLGLGMTITRRLVEMHDGEILAASEGRGCGSTLTVTLPLATARSGLEPTADLLLSPAQTRGESGTAPPLQLEQEQLRKRILLVEDHEPTRSTLARILTRRGHSVREAGTVAEALAWAEAGEIDVLISDIGLPDGDGYALLRRLRNRRPGLPGIAVSGYGTEEDICLSAQAGFMTHLVKPVDIHAIERSLREIV